MRQKCAFESVSLDRKRAVRDVIRLTFPITLSASLLSVSSLIDLGIIMRRLGAIGLDEAASSAEYGSFTTLALPMLMLVAAVITPVCVPLLPKLTERSCAGDVKGFSEMLENAVTKILVLCCPATFCFLLFPFDILDVLFTADASVRGAELLSLISPSVVLLPLLTALNTALEAAGRIRSTVFSLFVGAVVKSALAYILVGRSELGIKGAAISTTLSYLVSMIFSFASLSREISCTRIYRILFSLLSISGISYCAVYLFIYVGGPLQSGFLNLLLSGGAGTFFYVLFCLFYFSPGRKNAKLSAKCTKNAENN